MDEKMVVMNILGRVSVRWPGAVVLESCCKMRANDDRFELVVEPTFIAGPKSTLVFYLGLDSYRHGAITTYLVRDLQLSGVIPYIRSGWFPSFFVGAPLGIAVGRASEMGYKLPKSKTEREKVFDDAAQESVAALSGLEKYASDIGILQLAARSYPGLWDIASSVCLFLNGNDEQALTNLRLVDRRPTGYMPNAYPVMEARMSRLVEAQLAPEIRCARSEAEVNNLLGSYNHDTGHPGIRSL